MSSPTSDAVKALADAGLHEQASALALKYLAASDPSAERLLSRPELHALTLSEVMKLQSTAEGSDLLDRSMIALAVAAGKIPGPAPAPVPPSDAELAQPAFERGYLTDGEMRQLSADSMQILERDHPAVYQKSLDNLATTKGR